MILLTWEFDAEQLVQQSQSYCSSKLDVLLLLLPLPVKVITYYI